MWDAGQRSIELNGFGWSKTERLGVNPGEGVVYDRPRNKITLRDKTKRTKSKVSQASNALVLQYPFASSQRTRLRESRGAGGLTCGNQVPRQHRSLRLLMVAKRAARCSRGDLNGKADERPCGVVGAHFDRYRCHHVGRGTVVRKEHRKTVSTRTQKSTYQDLDCASTAVCRPVRGFGRVSGKFQTIETSTTNTIRSL